MFFGAWHSAQTSFGMCIEYSTNPFALLIKAASNIPLERNMIKPVSLSTSIDKDMIVFNNKKVLKWMLHKQNRNPWPSERLGGLHLRRGMTSSTEKQPKPAAPSADDYSITFIIQFLKRTPITVKLHLTSNAAH